MTQPKTCETCLSHRDRKWRIGLSEKREECCHHAWSANRSDQQGRHLPRAPRQRRCVMGSKAPRPVPPGPRPEPPPTPRCSACGGTVISGYHTCPPQPAGLTPGRLSDEDREGILALRSITIKQRTNWEIMLRSTDSKDSRLQANIAQADMAIQTAERLLAGSE